MSRKSESHIAEPGNTTNNDGNQRRQIAEAARKFF
jgi:hypothetical protein